MKSKHTKGFWHINSDGYIVDEFGNLIGSGFNKEDGESFLALQTEETKANVKLMSLAPLLLEKLIELTDYYNTGVLTLQQVSKAKHVIDMYMGNTE